VVDLIRDQPDHQEKMLAETTDILRSGWPGSGNADPG
jgi:hypothetical protein